MAPTKIAEILYSDLALEGTKATTATITDVKHLSSYNWIESPAPTIAIPGSPPLWSPPEGSRKVPKDTGLVYIAQNAARYPESPLEPLFRALYTTHPSYDIGTVDLITDRNNIRKLLSFVNPASSKNGLEPFTINIEVRNNAVVFCRAETATFEIIKPDEFRGFGHEFEKAYTRSSVDGSTGHHRIISYRFCGLKLIVRYETDGYVDSHGKVPVGSSTKPDKDNLSSLMESLSLKPSESISHTPSAKSRLVIHEEGRTVPTGSILEIKTRVAHKPIDLQEVMPQLWVSQTPNLVRAYHRNGVFGRPEVEHIMPDVKEWERKHQRDLVRLGALLKRIIKVAKEHGGRADLKYDGQCDGLVLWSAGK